VKYTVLCGVAKPEKVFQKYPFPSLKISYPPIIYSPQQEETFVPPFKPVEPQLAASELKLDQELVVKSVIVFVRTEGSWKKAKRTKRMRFLRI